VYLVVVGMHGVFFMRLKMVCDGWMLMESYTLLTFIASSALLLSMIVDWVA
jgi:hypothetical protein